MSDDKGMLVGDLIHAIGSATLVDAALGPDRGLAFDVRSGRRTLTDDQYRRVRVLHEVQADIAHDRSGADANMWLVAPNRLLGGSSPLRAIRDDRFEAVRDAARVFIHGDSA